MPSIAAALKAEIARIARKEHRTATRSLKTASTVHRSEIAALKRRVQEVERQLRVVARVATRAGTANAEAATVADGDGSVNGLRFQAKGLARNRQRLGLSAHDFGLLIGASGQSVYLWEQGKSRPSAKFIAAIAALRGVGKREVTGRLEVLKSVA